MPLTRWTWAPRIITVLSAALMLAPAVAHRLVAQQVPKSSAVGVSTLDSAAAARAGRAVERQAGLARARALLQVADTTGAAALLRDLATASPDDALVWHEYGMLLSAWLKPYWHAGSMPLPIVSRMVIADSALARAVRLEPDSAIYALHYGQHLFNTNQWNLHNAERVQTRAVAKAEQLGDTAALASGVDGLGLFMWRRYEPLANRRYGVLNLGYTANGIDPAVSR